MTAKNCTLTQKKLKEVLHYNPETGFFTWLTSGTGRCKDLVAGCKYTSRSSKSYWLIGINNKSYRAHRLAMLYMCGFWPDEIDHINGCGIDNRWINLRDVSRQENCKNIRLSAINTSGCTGVYWNKLSLKWESKIKVKGKSVHLGCFTDWFEAVCARKSAEYKYNFHPNHGTDRPL